MIKLVTAVIKPQMLDSVKDGLKSAGVHGLTVTEVKDSAARAGIPRPTEAPSTPSI